jgi:hypothetical protein
MGLRDRLVGLLSRGTAPEPDPDELVEVETMLPSEGPIALQALQDEGVDARTVDAFDPVSATTRVRLMAPRRQVAQARAVLDARR